MAYTTNQLIAGAFYKANVLSREFEQVGNQETGEALRWLNEVIARKVVEPDLIPYETQTTFTAVVGQKDYTIENLIVVDTLTFLKENVRYPVEYIPRDQFRGSARVENITSLPYQFYYEREKGGATVSLYFLPDQAYVFTITGILRLASVALNQDLDLTLDTFFQTYLELELAERICVEYGEPTPQGVARMLNSYRANISKQSRQLDMSVRKYSTLQKRTGFGWAYANLGQGYLP